MSQIERNHTCNLLWGSLLTAICLVLIVPEASAQIINTDMGFVVCRATDMVMGEIGSAIATIAVCTLGASACFGKISWPMAIGVAAGIAGFFGAVGLVHMLGASLACPDQPFPS